MPLAQTPTLGSNVIVSAETSRHWFINNDDWIAVGTVLVGGDPDRVLTLPTGGLPNAMWYVIQDTTLGGFGLRAQPFYTMVGTNETPDSIAPNLGSPLNGWFALTPPQLVAFGTPWVFQARVPGAAAISISLSVNAFDDPAKLSNIQIVLGASAS